MIKNDNIIISKIGYALLANTHCIVNAKIDVSVIGTKNNLLKIVG